MHVYILNQDEWCHRSCSGSTYEVVLCHVSRRMTGVDKNKRIVSHTRRDPMDGGFQVFFMAS